MNKQDQSWADKAYAATMESTPLAEAQAGSRLITLSTLLVASMCPDCAKGFESNLCPPHRAAFLEITPEFVLKAKAFFNETKLHMEKYTPTGGTQ